MAKQTTRPGCAGTGWTDGGRWWVGGETPCFYCCEPVGEVAVYWSGYDGTIALHSRCAVRLAQHLGMDAEREARQARLLGEGDEG